MAETKCSKKRRTKRQIRDPKTGLWINPPPRRRPHTQRSRAELWDLLHAARVGTEKLYKEHGLIFIADGLSGGFFPNRAKRRQIEQAKAAAKEAKTSE